jgi:hypothetical protein
VDVIKIAREEAGCAEICEAIARRIHDGKKYFCFAQETSVETFVKYSGVSCTLKFYAALSERGCWHLTTRIGNKAVSTHWVEGADMKRMNISDRIVHLLCLVNDGLSFALFQEELE